MFPKKLTFHILAFHIIISAVLSVIFAGLLHKELDNDLLRYELVSLPVFLILFFLAMLKSSESTWQVKSSYLIIGLIVTPLIAFGLWLLVIFLSYYI